MDVRNRREALLADKRTGGRACAWQYTSSLTVTNVFPDVASRLLRCCLNDWPLSLCPRPRNSEDEAPAISIIVGVRGTGRMAQFETCMRSLLAQAGVPIEVVVVEQSWQPEFTNKVPAGVRYLHQQCTSPDMPYNRSWALNGGAQGARGRILVLLDADMLLPQGMAAEIVRLMDGQGIEALRLPRLLFYLDRETSRFIQETDVIPEMIGTERVVANNRTPVAVTRQAYFAIGGHDEAFYGWGAEDDEFMERLRTRSISEGAKFPIIHLWHASAVAGEARESNARLLGELLTIAPEDRISILRKRDFGRSLPSVPWGPSV